MRRSRRRAPLLHFRCSTDTPIKYHGTPSTSTTEMVPASKMSTAAVPSRQSGKASTMTRFQRKRPSLFSIRHRHPPCWKNELRNKDLPRGVPWCTPSETVTVRDTPFHAAASHFTIFPLDKKKRRMMSCRLFLIMSGVLYLYIFTPPHDMIWFWCNTAGGGFRPSSLSHPLLAPPPSQDVD